MSIKARSLGKKYIIRHETTAAYRSLREELTGMFRPGQKNQVQKETFWAVKDLSFDISSGERVGILGRNGAGKSTLLKLLSRITEPTTGSFEMQGRVASLLEVGTGFHPELSGRENIFLNGAILGMSKKEIRSKFDDIVAFAEVQKFLDTPVKRYSSGMYVRLAFSVAAHLEPEILIVDEVLAVGDAAFQKKCLDKMSDISGQGKTILFVSHNISAIQKFCNKGMLLHKGEMLTQGPIQDVIEFYLNSGKEHHAVFEIRSPENSNELPGKINSVQIESTDGDLLSEIPVGKPWQCRVKFQIHKKCNHFITGFGIVTSMETSLRTSWTNPLELSPGNYEAVFINDDIILTSGHYSLVIGLSEEKKTFHYSTGEASLYISDVSEIVTDERIINTQSGLIINQSDAYIYSDKGDMIYNSSAWKK